MWSERETIKYMNFENEKDTKCSKGAVGFSQKIEILDKLENGRKVIP